MLKKVRFVELRNALFKVMFRFDVPIASSPGISVLFTTLILPFAFSNVVFVILCGLLKNDSSHELLDNNKVPLNMLPDDEIITRPIDVLETPVVFVKLFPTLLATPKPVPAILIPTLFSNLLCEVPAEKPAPSVLKPVLFAIRSKPSNN